MHHHHHFIIYKPQGYLSQFINNQNKRKNKKLLGTLHDFPKGTMAIGRLDENSEGLLLLTTDGKVSEQVRSKKIEKEYFIQLDGEITPTAIELLKKGVEISVNKKKYLTLPCEAKRLNLVPTFAPPKRKRGESHGATSWISITIREGKFRQVRKMSAAVGFPTIRLVRVRIGEIHLKNMQPAEVIEVNHFRLITE
ncbi:MAG: pseudouridine synthase [Saprospiraceae bacterium]